MNIYDNTWIKLPRDFVEWRWYHNTETVHLFLYLLLSANVKNKDYNNVTINRGELITSIRQLSLNTGMSIQTVRTCLKRLKTSKEIRYRKLNNQGTIIIIVDFNTYQPAGIDESVSSWIKLYRKMVNWEWFTDSKMSHLYVHFMLKGQIVYLPSINKYACQLETNRLKLCRETGISVQSLKTCIKKLIDAKEINYEQISTNHKSIVTICKYDDYKDDNTIINTALTQHQHSINTATKKLLVDELDSTNEIVELTDSNTVDCENNQLVANTALTQHQHSINTASTQHQHGINTLSKNIRKKEIKKERISSSSSTRMREEENFEEDLEKGLKENEQKKASKEGDDDFSMQLLSNEHWLSAMQAKYSLPSHQSVQTKLEEFAQDMKCRIKPPHKNLQDYVGHFCDWLTINLSKTSLTSQDVKPQNEKNGSSKREEEFAERQNVTANKANGDYSSEL